MVKKSFLTVLLVAIGIFAVSTAQAAWIDGLSNAAGPTSPTTIYVNPGGLGDALIYGYYNARGSFNYLRVVNTNTSVGVGAKIRFREGDDSNEVFDFFICLSAGDQWSAWIIGDTDAANPAVLLWFDDDTPTFPDPQDNNTVLDNFFAAQAFKHGSTGAARAVSANDTKEGYYEIIGVSSWADTPGATKTIRTPRACGEQLGLPNVDEIGGTGTPYPNGFTAVARVDVPNGLMGNHVIFDISDSTGAYGYNATALAEFRNAIVANPGLGTDDPPRLSDATEGLVAVNFILTKQFAYALYDIGDLLIGNSDIINTFPTRRLSFELSPGGDNGPFNAGIIDFNGAICVDANNNEECDTGELKVCEQIGIALFDDAENSPQRAGFSPGTTTNPEKCFDVNYAVVGATKTALLDTALLSFKLDVSTFERGWIREDFTIDPGLDNFTVFSGVTSFGLPVISYELGAFVEGEFSWMLPLRYTTSLGLNGAAPSSN